jgi:ubiquinol-cytochrome c reductase cytochrome b subunit
MHVARSVYYGSFKSPRVLVWSIGCIILILLMAIAFLGYVLPYGQMSLWGYFTSPKCILYKLTVTKMFDIISNYFHIIINLEKNISIVNIAICGGTSISKKISGNSRIGPHNSDVISIIFGSLLGDAHAERKNLLAGTRIFFSQEGVHLTYILWLHNKLSTRGYCNILVPKITTRLVEGGKLRKVVRLHTWSYNSFNWIHDLWYSDGIKLVPKNIANYLTPLALSIWIMDNGTKSSKGLKLITKSFTFKDCQFLSQVLQDNFNLKSSVQSAGSPNQYFIYILKESMPLLRTIVSPYIIPSMKYKIIE